MVGVIFSSVLLTDATDTGIFEPQVLFLLNLGKRFLHGTTRLERFLEMKK